MLLRFALIGLISIFFGLVHGLVVGISMPEDASVEAPDIEKFLPPSNNTVEIIPEIDEFDSESGISNSVQEESTDEFTVDRFFDFWAGGVATVLDARTLDEYNESHVLGALHMDMEVLNSGLPDEILVLPVDQLMIVYCGGGDCHASHSVGGLLKDYGYENVFIFEAGFPAWVDAGYPVE